MPAVQACRSYWSACCREYRRSLPERVTVESNSCRFPFWRAIVRIGNQPCVGSFEGDFIAVVVMDMAATSAAPCAFSKAAQRFMVLPVVSTSSHSRTRMPSSDTGAAENCSTFLWRSAAERVCCVLPVPLSCSMSCR